MLAQQYSYALRISALSVSTKKGHKEVNKETGSGTPLGASTSVFGYFEFNTFSTFD